MSKLIKSLGAGLILVASVNAFATITVSADSHREEGAQLMFNAKTPMGLTDMGVLNPSKGYTSTQRNLQLREESESFRVQVDVSFPGTMKAESYCSPTEYVFFNRQGNTPSTTTNTSVTFNRDTWLHGICN